MKFADPKNDVAFKKIFGNENRKEILISFLNNLLDFSGTPKEIIDLTIANPYQLPKLDYLKDTILDIKAKDKRGIHYIIEMQVFHTTALEKRVLYYVSKSYTQQLEKGDDYPILNQVIFLGFLDFNLFKANSGHLTHHLILEKESGENYFPDFDFHFVELPKFHKELDELEDVKDKWIYFVKNAGNMDMIPAKLTEPKEIKEAFEVANRSQWSREELDAYEKKGMYIQDERGRIEYALQEGEKIGIEKGEKLGEKKKTIEIAGELKKNGAPFDLIIKSTGLSKEEIENI